MSAHPGCFNQVRITVLDLSFVHLESGKALVSKYQMNKAKEFECMGRELLVGGKFDFFGG